LSSPGSRLIVARIPAEVERDGRLNELGPPAEEQQERAGGDRTSAELFEHRGTTQDALDLGDDGFGQQENETIGTPRPIDPRGQALGAGTGSA
jgi:hypothetical protein